MLADRFSDSLTALGNTRLRTTHRSDNRLSADILTFALPRVARPLSSSHVSTQTFFPLSQYQPLTQESSGSEQ